MRMLRETGLCSRRCKIAPTGAQQKAHLVEKLEESYSQFNSFSIPPDEI